MQSGLKVLSAKALWVYVCVGVGGVSSSYGAIQQLHIFNHIQLTFQLNASINQVSDQKGWSWGASPQ